MFMGMRKVFINLLIIAVLLSFVGCYEENVADENVNVATVEEVEENEDLEVVDDVSDVDAVDDVDDADDDGGADLEVEYIGNKKSLKFHYPWCRSAKRMKESNCVYFYGSRDEVVEEGYIPCENCYP